MAETPTPEPRSADWVLEDLRSRLLETGTRNRLIHVNRSARRANALNIINERADDVFQLLWTDRRKMRFTATGSDDPDADVPVVLAPPEDADSERYTDQYLETRLGPSALQKRLMRLAREARMAEEEQGVNILYIAIGFLKWFEDRTSSVLREAPLILLPADLVRNERTGRYHLQAREDDLVANMPLQQRLYRDFGIKLPEIDESGEEGTPPTPSVYFDAVADAVSDQTQWSIDRDGIQLGFFSFSKLLMLNDLYQDKWPNGELSDNALMQGLLSGGFETESPLFPDHEPLDPHLDPSDLLHVIDADASQAKAIEEARRGRSIVIQGPPGTGKSQTITNIIAGAAHDGKTVLFVAEKMAALDVVHRNLVNVGLEDLCLELHSRKANKRAVLEDLKRTLKAGETIPDSPGPPDRLRSARDELNHIDAILHTQLAGSDYTPFDALAEVARFYGREAEPPRLQADRFSSITQSERERLAALVTDHAEARRRVEPVNLHPFRGVTVLDLQPTDLQRIDRAFAEAVRALDAVSETAVNAATRIGLPAPDTLVQIEALCALLEQLAHAPDNARTYANTLYDRTSDDRLREALEVGANWRDMRDEIAPRFTETAMTADAERLRPALSKGTGSLVSRLFGGYRSASRELAGLLIVPPPRRPGERLACLDELLAVQRQRNRLAIEETYLSETLGTIWRGEQTDFSRLLAAFDWLKATQEKVQLDNAADLIYSMDNIESPSEIAADLRAKVETSRTAAQDPLHRLGVVDSENAELPTWRLNDLRERLASMQGVPEHYSDWCHFARSRDRLIEAGLGELLELIADGVVGVDRATDEFHYAVAESRWQAARNIHPELDELPQRDRHELVETFQALDKERIVDVRQLIRAKHLAQLPQGAVGEMGFLRGEMGKKRGHRPIRKIMELAGGMVQRIKPVFLMSPISVAQFLPPGKVDIDVLVIDEASQVRPEDAIGAIARARQVVVVGDQKQLPPTTFFDRVTGNTSDDGEEDDADEGTLPTTRPGEFESILTLCEARGLRQSMLEWHYRSRDPSLIAVSNAEFYGSRLILPPSPLDTTAAYGLSFRHVGGIYSGRHADSGRPGTNWVEAEAVVAAIAQHARDWPSYSLGIIAFSKAQSDMITQLLDQARSGDSHLDAFLNEDKREGTFVKNIEHVQGDERDVILISVGYGPQESDSKRLRMQFGPVNNEGGERRLNVLFTRSRMRCAVFASFDPGEMDLRRTTQEGPRVLKRFLDYAKTGGLAQRLVTGEEPDSPFEQDVADVIRSLGYPVDPQVGTAGFRIDLGVRNPDRPGEFLLAVECDGATYHGALWARERDRHRQDVLEDFGWRFHRIWSTDWFYRRSQEIERLRHALVSAGDAADAKQPVPGANTEIPSPSEDEPNEPIPTDTNPPDDGLPDTPRLIAMPYQKANFSVNESIPPHEVPTIRLADYVARVVEIEGPVHADEVARRIATIFNKGRTGRRIQEATQAALKRAQSVANLRHEGAFWFTDAQAMDVPVRDRSAETVPTTKADYLSPREICAAAAHIKRESGVVPEDELVRSIARLLGFQRLGQDLQTRIRESLNHHRE